MPNQHGGSRPNSGRKPLGDQPMVTRAFVIRQDQADWLEQAENKSFVVRRSIDWLMKTWVDAHAAEYVRPLKKKD